jgi:hypothetical protein
MVGLSSGPSPQSALVTKEKTNALQQTVFNKLHEMCHRLTKQAACDSSGLAVGYCECSEHI